LVGEKDRWETSDWLKVTITRIGECSLTEVKSNNSKGWRKANIGDRESWRRRVAIEDTKPHLLMNCFPLPLLGGPNEELPPLPLSQAPMSLIYSTFPLE
jgi:hypothetical protein